MRCSSIRGEATESSFPEITADTKYPDAPAEGKRRPGEMLKPVAVRESQVVDPGLAQELEEQVAEESKQRVKDGGKALRAEHPVGEPVEHARSAAHRRQDVDGVGAVVQGAAELEHHSFVDVETSCGDLIHDCAGVARVGQAQRANRLADADQA